MGDGNRTGLRTGEKLGKFVYRIITSRPELSDEEVHGLLKSEFPNRSTIQAISEYRRWARDDPARLGVHLEEVDTQVEDGALREDEADAASPAPRRAAIVERIVRDTAVTAEVKWLHNHVCQVCLTRLETPAGPYAEGAHVRPLGSPHDGPDVAENVLCLCPNHHVLFDSGTFGVADDMSLIGMEGRLATVAGHRVGIEYVRYHRRQVMGAV